MGVSEERAEQILLEEVLPRRPRMRDRTADEAQYRRLIARDVACMTKAGIVIDIPARWPELVEPDDAFPAEVDLESGDDAEGDQALAPEAARKALEDLRARGGM